MFRERSFVAYRIEAFARLGSYLRRIEEQEDYKALLARVEAENPFFTPASLRLAIAEWSRLLTEENLSGWIYPYAGSLPRKGGRLALVMAGNLPLVGFHDYLCGLLCGFSLQIRLSSKDSLLLPFLHQKLQRLARPESGFAEGGDLTVCFSKTRMEAFDAIIATGSGNTFRYFDYYFGKYPHILRRNRTSCAVLSGTETEAELQSLACDVFAYFGLGCRSVSKLYVPQGYDMAALAGQLAKASAPLMQTTCYKNNYDYHKAIYLVNRRPHLDTGSSLLVESEAAASPVSVVYYQTYADKKALDATLESMRDSLQCVVGQGYLPFGKAQSPALNDYADGVNTLDFLCRIGNGEKDEKSHLENK